MNKQKAKKQNKTKRHQRVRAKISGSAACPRLSVYRSLKHIYAQLIDDNAGKTILSVSDREIKDIKKKEEAALALGKLLAEKALAENINQAVFDRGGFKYHGRVKAVAEGARQGGLKI